MTSTPKRTVLDQMHEAWESDRCPACGGLKQSRTYWFCKMDWWKLPKEIQNALKYRPDRAAAQWLQAMAILKQTKEKAHG